MNYQPSAEEVRAGIEEKLSRHFGWTHTEASRDQMYKAAAMTVKEILTEKRGQFKKKVNRAESKRI